MASIPLSKIPELVALVERRTDLLARVARCNNLISVAVFFRDNGTDSEPLADSLTAKVRDLLVADILREIAAIDDDLRAAGIDPNA